MDEMIIVIFNMVKKKQSVDIEIPTDITARELVIALNQAYDLEIDITDVQKCYLKAENPIALMRGNRLIRDYGLRNGSVINYTE